MLKDCDQLQIEYYIQECFSLAKKALGKTSPNPIVGAMVLDEFGNIVGRGYHEKAGMPHAEINAINEAGLKTKNGTLFVSLEPCCHIGKTGPCTQAIIESGIKNVFYSASDINPLVSGNGKRELLSAGISVVSGILESEGIELNRFFNKWIKSKIPYITLKQAQTLDGFVANKSTIENRWISSEESRNEVHMLRSEFDAIFVGANTVIRDNPALTCRISNGRSPKRVILDKDLVTDSEAKIYENDGVEIFLITSSYHDNNFIVNKYLKKNNNIKVIQLPKDNHGYLNLREVFATLGKYQILSVLVESGPNLATRLIKDNLIDEYLLFIAPWFLGSKNGISTLNVETISDITNSLSFTIENYKVIGNDFMLSLRPKKI